ASPAVAEVGDAITYTYTVNNTSSTDSPNLVLSSLTDTVLGNLTATASASGCGSLAPGASCTFGVSRTILATDPTPLPNSATVTFPLADPRFSTGIPAPASASVIIVDAAISIAPSGVNAVGNPHTFTITVTAIPNGASPVSFGPITPSVSPAPGSMTSTCGAPTVAGNTATCTVTINNSTPDTFTANASAEVTMGGKTVGRSTSTNSGPGGSGAAVKKYVDAKVEIAPDRVNAVGTAHTFTITVTALPGNPALTPTLVSVVPSVSPTPASMSTTCGGASFSGSVATCTLTISSAMPGTFTATATATVGYSGLSPNIVRTTDGSETT